MTDPILVVGGGPAGLAAARGYRDAGGTAPVVMVTDDDRPPYRRPPLSKEHLRGELPAAELLIEPPGWYPEHDVELVHDRVAELDVRGRRAVTAGGRVIAYGGAVLATGATPVRPPVDGADEDCVHVLRTAIHSAKLQASTGAGTRVVVVGAGFIGCEAAVSLARRGAHVTLVADEDVPQARRLGTEVGERILAWLVEEGVQPRLGAPIDGIARDGDTLRVAVGRATLAADVVLLGAGVQPRDELARAAGLAMGPEGRHIAVDAGMATSVPGVYAAGDVTFAGHAVAGRALHVEHWGDALAHGEIAGRRLGGDDAAVWDTVPGFWSTIGDRTLKYAAWGDGHDDVELVADSSGFTASYRGKGRLVGVLTHEHDDDYDAGRERISSEARR
jgi:3-phenylpropionate/trans-cinnamate dioxygenase ferredoxin reductase subunit